MVESTLTTRDNARNLFEKMAPEFQKVLSSAIPPEKFVRIALTALNKTPKLLQCSQTSILGALMESATLGLEPDGKHAAIIPFKEHATLVPMVKGLVKLAHNNPKVLSIDAGVVRKKDEFRYRKGTESRIEHLPSWPTKEAGEMIAVYAIAELAGGGKQFVVLDRDQVMAIKAKSPGASKKDSPWNDPTFEPAMWEKTAIKQLCKRIPSSAELNRALTLDDEADLGRVQSIQPVTIPHEVLHPPMTDEELGRLKDICHKAPAKDILEAAFAEFEAHKNKSADQVSGFQSVYKLNLERLEKAGS